MICTPASSIPAVGDARHLRDLALGEQQPQHPAGADAEAAAHAAALALQHHHLAPRRAGLRLPNPPGWQSAAIDAPLGLEVLRRGRHRLRRRGEELGDVEADAAGADDGHRAAGLARAAEDIDVADALGVVDAGNGGHAGDDAGRHHDRIEARGRQLAGARAASQLQIDAEPLDAAAEVAQRLVELLLARHVAGEIELPADPPLRLVERHARARARPR